MKPVILESTEELYSYQYSFIQGSPTENGPRPGTCSATCFGSLELLMQTIAGKEKATLVTHLLSALVPDCPEVGVTNVSCSVQLTGSPFQGTPHTA